MQPIDALVFDAYGTLYDVHSIAALCENAYPGRGPALSQLWRAKQLEYSWLRSLMGRYRDFQGITGDALEYACEALGLALDAPARDRFLGAYLALAPFPDALPALEGLQGRPRAILSNGSPEMLEPLVRGSALAPHIDQVISVAGLHIFKPWPAVYQLAVDRLGVPPARIGFVSSNAWDACGAQSFGLNAFWVNRSGQPADRLGVVPAAVIASLAELPRLVSPA